jgi:hypothetical protein
VKPAKRTAKSKTLPSTGSGSRHALRPNLNWQRQKNNELNSHHYFQYQRQLPLEPDNQHQQHHGKPLPSRTPQTFYPVGKPKEIAETRPSNGCERSVRPNAGNCKKTSEHQLD